MKTSVVGRLGTFSVGALLACSAATPPPAAVVEPSTPSATASPVLPVQAADAPAAPAEPAKVCSKDGDLDTCHARCAARDAAACELVGDMLLVEDNPDAPIKGYHVGSALRAFDQACALGVESACAKRDLRLKDMRSACAKSAAQAKEGGRFSCDYSPAKGRRRVRSKAKLDAASASSLGKAEVSALEEVLSRRLGDCYRAPPAKPAQLEISLVPDTAAKLASLTPGVEQACVASVVEEIHLGATASPKLAFVVDFETITATGKRLTEP